METLLERIDQMFRPRVERMRLLIPYRDGPALALCYDRGRVIERADLPEGIRVEVEVPRAPRHASWRPIGSRPELAAAAPWDSPTGSPRCGSS